MLETFFFITGTICSVFVSHSYSDYFRKWFLWSVFFGKVESVSVFLGHGVERVKKVENKRSEIDTHNTSLLQKLEVRIRKEEEELVRRKVERK
jgi:hypothetical protein